MHFDRYLQKIINNILQEKIMLCSSYMRITSAFFYMSFYIKTNVFVSIRFLIIHWPWPLTQTINVTYQANMTSFCVIRLRLINELQIFWTWRTDRWAGMKGPNTMVLDLQSMCKTFISHYSRSWSFRYCQTKYTHRCVEAV